MAHRQQIIVRPAAAGSSRHGYMRLADDLKGGKVITEQYIPIAKQVTKDYQTGKVKTAEVVMKKTTTKDYLKGTVTTETRTTAKSVTEDRMKGIKTIEKRETTETATKDYRNNGPVVTKQSHHSSKEICPMSMFTQTTKPVKGKAH